MSSMAGKRRIQKIRNIGIIAHIDAGKTTLTERILFYTGKIHRMGEVHEGQATMDYLPEEQERGITITSAVTTCYWKDCEIHIIDTPGHVDFTIEVERSLRVLDGAIGVFCAVGGVEPQSETVWHQAERFRIPKIAFINKMDRIGANFWGTVQEMKEKLGTKPVIITMPYGAERDFQGVIDIIREKLIIWDEESQGERYKYCEVPMDVKDKVASIRQELLETIVEFDEKAMEKYLADEPISEKEIHDLIRRGTLSLNIVPVFCGAALRNKGVQPLLDAIVRYLPSPIDIPPIRGINPETGKEEIRYADESAPLAALAFKVQIFERRKMVYIRVYSGTLEVGKTILNAPKRLKEKVARIFLMHANKRVRLERAQAGDIVAVMGLKHTKTGDTLCDLGHPILLEPIEAYEPVISIAIEPRTSSEEEKLETALAKMSEEDPTFRIREDKDTGQRVISGMGELHLEVILERMRREFGLEVTIGRPQVVYRETVTKEVEVTETFDQTIGEDRLAATVKLRVRPRKRGAGNLVGTVVPDGKLPQEKEVLLIETIEKAFQAGIEYGYPIVDTEVILIDIEFPTGSFNEMAARAATAAALRKAFKEADPILLEPIMEIEVVSPSEFLGEVINELNIRKGHIIAIETKEPVHVIKAEVPLSKMFGYSTDLRSATQGRASFMMRFKKFDQPESLKS